MLRTNLWSKVVLKVYTAISDFGAPARYPG